MKSSKYNMNTNTHATSKVTYRESRNTHKHAHTNTHMHNHTYTIIQSHTHTCAHTHTGLCQYSPITHTQLECRADKCQTT